MAYCLSSGFRPQGLSRRDALGVKSSNLVRRRRSSSRVISLERIRRVSRVALDLTKFPLQTAEQIRLAVEATARGLSCPVYLQPDLRERGFGDLELQSSANYERVWEQDAIDALHTTFGVESVSAVAQRMKHSVDLAERHFVDRDIVMVSHGDSLQILQTVFAGVDKTTHRSLPHLETCELRRLC